MRSICRGNLEVVQWVYENGNINIHDNYEDAFLLACDSRYLHIAQWLYSLGNINIHVNNEEVFRYAIMNKHDEISDWLCSIYDGYWNKYVIESYIERISKMSIKALMKECNLSPCEDVCVICFELGDLARKCGHAYCRIYFIELIKN